MYERERQRERERERHFEKNRERQRIKKNRQRQSLRDTDIETDNTLSYRQKKRLTGKETDRQAQTGNMSCIKKLISMYFFLVEVWTAPASWMMKQDGLYRE